MIHIISILLKSCVLNENIWDKVIRSQFICVLYVKKIDTVFLMCGHLVVCNKCSKITQCPECKSAITEIVQIYYE